MEVGIPDYRLLYYICTKRDSERLHQGKQNRTLIESVLNYGYEYHFI